MTSKFFQHYFVSVRRLQAGTGAQFPTTSITSLTPQPRSNRTRFPRFTRAAICALAFILTFALNLYIAPLAHAEAPAIDGLSVYGAQAGTTAKITFSGKLAPWPVHGWADVPAIEFKPQGSNGVFQIAVATNTPPGPHLIRLFNADGVSRPRIFMVGRFPEIDETEPNDGVANAQSIAKLPATINGKFDQAGDVDSFAVRAEAGQTLVAECNASMIGAPLDCVINLRDAAGNKLAFVHDGIGLDPLLAFPVTKSGTYIVQVSGFSYPPAADVRFTGGKGQFYRLSITTGPYVRNAFPAGVARGTNSSVELSGWNLGAPGKAPELTVNANASLTAKTLVTSSPRFPNRIRLALGERPEIREVEPNNTLTNAQPITPPATINGRIDPAGDVDRFAFTARKGERFEMRLASASLGFPLDSLLRVEDSTGKELARNDDATSGEFDSRLVWSSPADGTYFATVKDLFSKGGPEFVYRLEIGAPLADFTVAADNHAYTLQSGKTNEIKITIAALNNFQSTNFVVAIDGLPEGVTLAPPKVPAKGGEVKLSLVADTDAEPSNQPIQIKVTAADAKPPRTRTAFFGMNAKDTSPDLFINETDQLWLTVSQQALKVAPAPKKKKK